MDTGFKSSDGEHNNNRVIIGLVRFFVFLVMLEVHVGKSRSKVEPAVISSQQCPGPPGAPRADHPMSSRSNNSATTIIVVALRMVRVEAFRLCQKRCYVRTSESIIQHSRPFTYGYGEPIIITIV